MHGVRKIKINGDDIFSYQNKIIVLFKDYFFGISKGWVVILKLPQEKQQLYLFKEGSWVYSFFLLSGWKISKKEKREKMKQNVRWSKNDSLGGKSVSTQTSLAYSNKSKKMMLSFWIQTWMPLNVITF